jgi:hypothetical protein
MEPAGIKAWPAAVSRWRLQPPQKANPGLQNGGTLDPDVGDAPDMAASFVSSLSVFYGLTISMRMLPVKQHPTAEIT